MPLSVCACVSKLGVRKLCVEQFVELQYMCGLAIPRDRDMFRKYKSEFQKKETLN